MIFNDPPISLSVTFPVALKAQLPMKWLCGILLISSKHSNFQVVPQTGLVTGDNGLRSGLEPSGYLSQSLKYRDSPRSDINMFYFTNNQGRISL